MRPKNILLIEDEDDIRELVGYNLRKEGHTVLGVASGEEGLEEARVKSSDLVVLDLMLPKMDGFEVCRVLKGSSQTNRTPILIISARGEEADIVRGLEIGADDYITKPFSTRILVARVTALLRRVGEERPSEKSALQLGEFSIDPGKFEVLLAGREVSLTATEFRLLHFLARHPGWVFTRYQIVDAVKGESYAVTERSVDVQIVGLRKKLGDFGRHVETVRGVGYRFKKSFS